MNYFKKKNYHNTKPLWGWVIALISMGLIFACSDSTSSSDAAEEKTPTFSVLSGWREYNQNNPITMSTAGTAISTLEELKAMTVDGEYHLTANIDLGTEDWAPLHTAAAPFTGTLHGNGYIVYGLNINAPEANYQGLFAALNGATINNLGIGVKAITANAMAGGLAGHAENSTLSNVAAGAMDTDSVISVDDVFSINAETAGGFAGGLVGYLAAGGSMTDGWNEGLTVRATGDGGRVGGLVGRALSSVTGTSSGDVSAGSGNDVGGLVGSADNSITVTGTASGNVSSGSGVHVGGLVGSANFTAVTGSASGNVSSGSGSKIGGLVGNLGNNAASATGTASGNVSSESGENVGGLVGIASGSVTGVASGNVSSVSGQSVGGLVGGRAPGGTILGYSIGWVMAGKDNTQTAWGAVIGGTTSTHQVYYNSEGGDHVGTIDEASATKINETVTGATGERGTNNIGTAIEGTANATATNMDGLTVGTEVGQWTFTTGQWPKVNLPDGVTDFMDYTTSPSAPANFVD